MAAMSLFSIRGVAWAVFAATIYGALLFSAVLAETHSPVVSAAAITAAPAPAPLVAVPAQAPAPKTLTLHEKVVATLRAAGHYGAISGLLDSLSESTIIKEGITLFAPDDTAFNGVNMNSSALLTTTLDYHVATKVYNYQALSSLPLNSTIQTAAPNVVIVITSTGANSLRLDDVAIVDPNLYSDGQVAVHGVGSVFNTAKYNKGVVPPEAAPATAVPAQAPGLITPPTAPETASPAGTGNDAAHVMANVVYTVLLISAVPLVISLL